LKDWFDEYLIAIVICIEEVEWLAMQYYELPLHTRLLLKKKKCLWSTSSKFELENDLERLKHYFLHYFTAYIHTIGRSQGGSRSMEEEDSVINDPIVRNSNGYNYLSSLLRSVGWWCGCGCGEGNLPNLT